MRKLAVALKISALMAAAILVGGGVPKMTMMILAAALQIIKWKKLYQQQTTAKSRFFLKQRIHSELEMRRIILTQIIKQKQT